jgi:transcriptional/translational regulatory protein YebC/TACO1
VKHLLSKNGGSLANSGAVTYLFDHVGVVRVPSDLPSDRHDELELAFIESGASDVLEEEGVTEIRCAMHDLAKVAVAKSGLHSDTQSNDPKTLVETDEETGSKFLN